MDVDRVCREDLLLFVNAGFTATGQGGYYHGVEQERLSLEFLHSYMAVNYRRLYTLLLAAGLNHFNLGHAVQTLLTLGSPQDKAEKQTENELLDLALRSLPPQRAYRLFEKLARARVNNRRCRALMRTYLQSRRDLAFDAVKYRARLRTAVLHAHLCVDQEVKRFLFEGAQSRPYSHPILESYRQAHFDQRAIYELPFTVAQGLAQRKGIPKEEFLEKIAPRMTEREKLRWQQAGAQSFDPAKADLIELCLYALRLPIGERMELLGQAQERAQDLARQLQLKLLLGDRRMAAVLDRSRSSIGSERARRRPLAVALAFHLTLQASGVAYSAHWSHPTPRLEDLAPVGHTALGDSLLEALRQKPDFVVVVSDGRENAPSGACEALAYTVERRLPGVAPIWLHLNPVFDPEEFQPLSLGPNWPVLGLRRIEDFPLAFELARFARGKASGVELESYLEARVKGALGAYSGRPSRSGSSAWV